LGCSVRTSGPTPYYPNVDFLVHVACCYQTSPFLCSIYSTLQCIFCDSVDILLRMCACQLCGLSCILCTIFSIEPTKYLLFWFHLQCECHEALLHTLLVISYVVACCTHILAIGTCMFVFNFSRSNKKRQAWRRSKSSSKSSTREWFEIS